jgi:hypothetical protein
VVGIWEGLTAPPTPPLAIEVRGRSVGVVRLKGHGRRRALHSLAAVELSEGVLDLNLLQPNIVDSGAFRQALRQALERTGSLHGGPVALVLPDRIARVMIIAEPAKRSGPRVSREDALRYQLRNRLPFDVREARLATHALGTTPGGERLTLVAAVFRPVLLGYEEACLGLALQPGRVELSGLALLRAPGIRAAEGDSLVVNWDHEYLSLTVCRGGEPVLLRTVTAPQGIEELRRESASTMLYYRERLGGTGLARVFVRSARLPFREVAGEIAAVVGLEPQELDPLATLGTQLPDGAREVAQQVAGACAAISEAAA